MIGVWVYAIGFGLLASYGLLIGLRQRGERAAAG
jgi:hypothetical protein